MSRVKALGYRFERFINPIAVKELRQAVQGRFVMGKLLLFLTIAVIILGFVSIAYGEDVRDFQDGRIIFQIFLGLLMGTCLLFLPLYVGVRMSLERSDNDVDLLYATTLKAGAIIRGKLQSAAILCLIMYSICTPFMTLTYLLRGIDLLSIFFLLGMSYLMMVGVIQVVIFLATLPVSKWFKLLLGAGAMFGIVMLFIGAIILAEELLRSGIGSMMAMKEFWLVLAMIIGLVAMGEGLLYVLSVAIISPNTVNRAFPVRVYMTSVWLISGVICMACAVHYSLYEVVAIWGITSLIFFTLALFASVSERDKLGARVRRSIPKNMLLRMAAFFFFSGVAGGLFWSCLVIALTMGVMVFSMPIFPRLPRFASSYPMTSFLFDISGMLLYLAGYALMGCFVRRRFLSHWFRTEITWGISAMLMVIFSVIPIIIAFFVKADLENGYMWYLGNPGAIFWYPRHTEIFVGAGAIWAFLGLMLNGRWLINQMRQFVPLGPTNKVTKGS